MKKTIKNLIKLLTIISSIIFLATVALLLLDDGPELIEKYEIVSKTLMVNVFCSPILAIVDAILNWRK